MQKALFLIVLVPLLALAWGGAHASSPTPVTCGFDGGTTVAAATLTPPSGVVRTSKLYLYADPEDAASGLYAETNGVTGLQITPQYWRCSDGSAALVASADESLLEYAPHAR